MRAQRYLGLLHPVFRRAPLGAGTAAGTRSTRWTRASPSSPPPQEEVGVVAASKATPAPMPGGGGTTAKPCCCKPDLPELRGQRPRHRGRPAMVTSSRSGPMVPYGAWDPTPTAHFWNDTYTSSDVPVQGKGVEGITAVASGVYSLLALRSDGSMWAWGLNEYGELGTHANTNDAPAQVLGLSGVVAACRRCSSLPRGEVGRLRVGGRSKHLRRARDRHDPGLRQQRPCPGPRARRRYRGRGRRAPLSR